MTDQRVKTDLRLLSSQTIHKFYIKKEYAENFLAYLESCLNKSIKPGQKRMCDSELDNCGMSHLVMVSTFFHERKLFFPLVQKYKTNNEQADLRHVISETSNRFLVVSMYQELFYKWLKDRLSVDSSTGIPRLLTAVPEGLGKGFVVRVSHWSDEYDHFAAVIKEFCQKHNHVFVTHLY